jgi:hypothetical protein
MKGKEKDLRSSMREGTRLSEWRRRRRPEREGKPQMFIQLRICTKRQSL